VLEPAYPNPFNPETSFTYKLTEDGEVTLSVMNLMGQRVATIVNGEFQRAGSYYRTWNGLDTNGRNAPSGVYLLLLETGTKRQMQKVMLVR